MAYAESRGNEKKINSLWSERKCFHDNLKLGIAGNLLPSKGLCYWSLMMMNAVMTPFIRLPFFLDAIFFFHFSSWSSWFYTLEVMVVLSRLGFLGFVFFLFLFLFQSVTFVDHDWCAW